MNNLTIVTIATFLTIFTVGCEKSPPPVKGPAPVQVIPASALLVRRSPASSTPSNVPGPDYWPLTLPLTLEEMEDGCGAPMPPRGIWDDRYEQVVQLISQHKTEELYRILEGEPHLISYKHSQRGNLLSTACAVRRIDVARYLIERGADPNVASWFGGPSLRACINSAIDLNRPVDYVAILDLLLANGADATLTKTWHGTGTNGQALLRSSDTFLEYGEKLQYAEESHSIARNAVLSRLREHLNLPVDAMLPVNAESLYLRRTGSKKNYTPRELQQIMIRQIHELRAKNRASRTNQ